MIWMWIGLIALVAVILVIDLAIVHRKGRELSLKESLGWTAVWMSVGAGFSGLVYLAWSQGWYTGHEGYTAHKAALVYFTAWALEMSLSLDNIFVMALVFKRWNIHKAHQHQVLFYGILGAVVFRFAMIILGTEAVKRFDWLIPIFGLYLLYQGGKALREQFSKNEDSEDEKPLPTRFLGLRLTEPGGDGHFFERSVTGAFGVTTLFAALLTIEGADILFALDSVPAALNLSQETWIIVSANALAIIGLRSLYSVLSEVLERYHELHVALGLLLIFIGATMGLALWFDIPHAISLAVIVLLVGGGFLMGWLRERRAQA